MNRSIRFAPARPSHRQSRRLPPGLSRRLLLSLLPLLLAACASLGTPRPPSDTPPDIWRGRFALTVEPSPQAPDGQRSSGRFVLTHASSFTELELISPLGNTLAAARSDAQGATLKTADGRTWNATSPDELTEQMFGWRIPITRLPPWLRGQVEQVTEAGPPVDGRPRPVAGLDQGWQVRFDQWGASEPQRLTVVYPGRVNLRLIVDER